MIETPTVFVVGAGASIEYGFPSGFDLLRQVLDGVTNDTAIVRQQLLAAGFREGDLEDFYQQLKYSESLSVNTFLEGNEPQIVEIGKTSIATMVLHFERSCKETEKLFLPNLADHWLRYLWNLMRAQCGDVNSFRRNNVWFVTFNYERTIEYYFQTVLANAFRLSQHDATKLQKDVIPVVHLHGLVDKPEFGVGRPPISGDEIRRIATGIKVIHERIPSGDPAFDRAYRLFNDAKQICPLGFGFHPVNLERLRLRQVSEEVSLICSCYELGQAEIRAAETRIGRAAAFGDRGHKAEKFLRNSVVLT